MGRWNTDSAFRRGPGGGRRSPAGSRVWRGGLCRCNYYKSLFTLGRAVVSAAHRCDGQFRRVTRPARTAACVVRSLHDDAADENAGANRRETDRTYGVRRLTRIASVRDRWPKRMVLWRWSSVVAERLSVWPPVYST